MTKVSEQGDTKGVTQNSLLVNGILTQITKTVNKGG